MISRPPEAYHTIDDLRAGTRRRVPKLAFDYLDGGAGDEANLRRNRSGFGDITLRPEYLRDVSDRSQKVTLFGHTYDAPIGVSPVGLANLIWPETDRTLATMAASRNVPYTLSCVATTSIEDIAKIAPDHFWFQHYIPEREDICFDLVRRAREAEARVMVLTVDIPVPAKRLRDLRNNFILPFKYRPQVIWDVATHPVWALETRKAGPPKFMNIEPYVEDTPQDSAFGTAQAAQVSPKLGEDMIKRIRDAWDGPLVVKGLLSPNSAEAAKRIGADGIIVSNHGGRQMDSAPSTIEALPGVVAAVGEDIPVMLDSGIRTGVDIVKAYCLGAKFVFSGRCFVYATGALGSAGGKRAMDILTDEVDRTLAQMGCTAVEALGPDYVWPNE